MKIIKSSFAATLFFLTMLPVYAQTGNVMTLTKIIHTTTTTHSSNSPYPSSSTMMTTSFEFSINGSSMGSVGRHYKNLERYFKNCDAAMQYLETTRRRDKIETISKLSGAGLFLVGGIIIFTKENKTPGIVVASSGLGLAVFGMVEQAFGLKSLRKSVAAYNACERNKNKTGLLRQLVPTDIAVVSLKMDEIKPGVGLRLSWALN